MGLSIDREKVIKGLEYCTKGEVCISDCPYFKEFPMTDGRCITALQADALKLLKEQGKTKFFVDSDGKITPLPDVVRCKDCVHRGKVEKCVLAAIAAEKNYPLFMLDNRGEWYCADGERKEGR